MLFEAAADLPGLVVDVGAHRGQSAVSILRRTRRLRVLSFEPNRSLRPSLLLVKLLHPFRFRFQITAVGETDGTATLRVPGSKGSSLSPQAALNPAEFRKPAAAERLAAAGIDIEDPSAFRRMEVAVTALDGTGLRPDVVKIDAEGSEDDALRGMRRILGRHQPALLIEVNDTHVWEPRLRALGYALYRYVAVDGVLRPLERPEDVLNVVALHPASPSAVSRALSARIERPGT